MKKYTNDTTMNMAWTPKFIRRYVLFLKGNTSRYFSRIPVAANVLDKESLEAARKTINEKLGTCDILLNGAGGNNPKGTTTKEYLFPDDLKDAGNAVTFFDLDPKGIEFVFNLCGLKTKQNPN